MATISNRLDALRLARLGTLGAEWQRLLSLFKPAELEALQAGEHLAALGISEVPDELGNRILAAAQKYQALGLDQVAKRGAKLTTPAELRAAEAERQAAARTWWEVNGWCSLEDARG